MGRNSGLRFLLGAFEYTFASGCLLGMNLILMAFFGLLRNLPSLIKAMREILRESLIFAYRVYSPGIAYLRPFALRHLGVDLEANPARFLATALFSLLIHVGVWLILGWDWSLVWIAMSVLHGAAVGLLWEQLVETDGLHMGERIE